MIQDTTLAYLAGFVDGDGSIRVNPKRTRPESMSATCSISVSNTHPQIPHLLKLLFGGNLCLTQYKTPNSKPVWRWRLFGVQAANMVRLIYPYLVRKRLQAENLLDFEDYRQRLHQERMTKPPGQQGYTREQRYSFLNYATRSKELNAFGRRASGSQNSA